ncbi:hypothetical protein V2J09_021660, partial [Rumex salicifolius]
HKKNYISLNLEQRRAAVLPFSKATPTGRSRTLVFRLQLQILWISNDPENMAKKHNNQIGGFEAPRNSLELLADSFHSCYAVREYEPCKYAVRQNMSKNNSMSANASMKKLISDEISKVTNHKQRSPSIVARLMGMDVFPSDTESVGQPFELKDDSAEICGRQRQYRDNLSTRYARRKYSGDKDLHSSDKHMYNHLLTNGTSLEKPRHRLHPQEKELQQFKKDFAAWQSSRFLECAKVADLEHVPDQWLAQLDMTKEKMISYENARKSAHQKAESLVHDALKPKISNGANEEYCGYRKSSLSPKHKKSYGFRTKSLDREFEELSVMDFDKRSNKPYAPAKIVILKPGPDSFSSNDESWASSSASVDDRDCIEDLLEEVKERINFELQGKLCRRGGMIRGGGIETPFKERSSYTSQRSRDLKMQVREKTTGDLARQLLRSESTRSCRSDTYPNDDSPEFTRQDSKQLLSKQLRSVLNGENHHNIQNAMEYSSRSIALDDTRGRLEQVRNILNATNVWDNWNESNNGDYPEATSFRHEYAEEETSEGELSPRNLVRSLSAPVSGTSFGKLLLEDRHILTGAQVRRKHEALESVRASVNEKDQKKERFKIREKVSTIKCNFTLKGKLFSQKFHSFDLSQSNEYELIKDINSGPTVLLNLPDRNENYTEVPPSPASVCSSTHEEPWKPAADHTSTISASDITSLEDQTADKAFKEIKSNHDELKADLNQIDYEVSEVTTISEEPLEAEAVDLEDQSEIYIRELLVVSGLYNGSSTVSSSTLYPFEKLIDDQVFEKLEESYIKSNEQEEDSNRALFNHKMLFDLLNEALSIVLKPPKTFTGLQRNTISSTFSGPPHGRSLLQKVWTIISQHTYPSLENDFPSLEDMVSHDLDFVPWFDLIDEELKVVSSDMEALITSYLIEEATKDI